MFRGQVTGAVGALALMMSAGLAFGQGEAGKWAVLELDGPVLEAPEGFEWLFGAEKPLFRQMIESVREARDNDLGGIVVQVKDLQLNGTQIEELGAALRYVREGGTKVHVFAENFGPAELTLGAYADQIVMQSGGSVTLPGMHMEEMFLADTLGWVGVKADFVQVGDYKGASEMFARSAPSPTWDESINTMLDGLYANQRATLKAGRKLDDAGLDAAMKSAWMASGQSAIEAKLIDAQIDLPDLPAHLEKVTGAKVSWAAPIAGEPESSLDMSNPFALLAKLGQQPDNTPTGPTIAVVHITGSIVDGESSAGGLLGGGGSVGSRTIRKALSEIEKEELVKGVVVRIDSPGGSATASEMIWQGLKRVAKTKPVYVSIGSMAASGGYYIAVGGDKVFANPSSIVGSIGVVGGKFVMQGLYDMVKAGVVERSRGPMASMMSTKSVWSPQERELVRQKMTETYDLFASRVSAGRPGIDLKKTAEGRLFAGTQARELKMVDEIGGLHDAVTALASKLGLEDYEVRDYPGPRSLDEMLKGFLPGMASAPVGGASANAANVASIGLAGLEAIMGPRAFAQVRSQLSALIQMREERVMLVMPRIVVVK
ncbi:MAG: signal peptide peptidase SppA [Planctomycetota bacterium]|nr:signal peptide peptidase SppA [Planctomycetota bacterium]